MRSSGTRPNEEPETVVIASDEVSGRRISNIHAEGKRVAIRVTDEQAEQLLRFYQGDAFNAQPETS